MAEPSTEWVDERTFGGSGRPFWWRLADHGELAILRVQGKRGKQEQVVRAFSRDELDKLLEFMADGTWHRLASSFRDMKSASRADGVGAFLYQVLGRGTSYCVVASHLAVVLTNAGVWAWDGLHIGMRFRQLDGDLARVAAYYARRLAGEPAPPPEDVRRERPEPPPVHPPGYSQAVSFRGRATELRGRLQSAEGGRHGGSKGQRREAALRGFLREHLPGRYGISAGEVAEPSGEISRQVDILIYDAIDSDPLEAAPDAMVLAAESIYAAIEVKPILDAAFLDEAAQVIRSVKALPRDSLYRSPVPDGRGRAPNQNPAPFGAIVGWHATEPERLAARLRELQAGKPPSLWVDAICILDEAVIHRQGVMPGPTGWSPALSGVPTPYAVVEAGEDALLYLLTLLRCDLRSKRLWPYDPVSYARDMSLSEPKLV